MSKIKRYGINKIGSDYAVGDIHGCFKAVSEKLNEIGFNPKTDRLFSVGDLVDRGNESLNSTEWMDKPWFHAVRGNHEQMAIDCVNGMFDRQIYIINGGEWFLNLEAETKKKYADRFAEMPIAIEVETSDGIIGIIHAECPVKDWADLKDALEGKNADAFVMSCLWSRDRIKRGNTSRVEGVVSVVHGHTILTTDQWVGNAHYIDTGLVSGGYLTIIKIN